LKGSGSGVVSSPLLKSISFNLKMLLPMFSKSFAIVNINTIQCEESRKISG
jgi:hypothetical protein